MNKSKSITVEFGEFGLPFIEPKKNTDLNYRILADGTLSIEGNKNGLRLLAPSLLGLAECSIDDGYHIHLDDLDDLNEDGNSIVIYKK